MQSEPTSRRRPRLPPGLRDVLVGLFMIVGGAGAQLGLPTVGLTCDRGADGATSCVIERKMLFGTVARSREEVHGVTGARTTQWDNRSKRDD